MPRGIPHGERDVVRVVCQSCGGKALRYRGAAVCNLVIRYFGRPFVCRGPVVEVVTCKETDHAVPRA